MVGITEDMREMVPVMHGGSAIALCTPRQAAPLTVRKCHELIVIVEAHPASVRKDFGCLFGDARSFIQADAKVMDDGSSKALAVLMFRVV